jgi:hypothetical protein
MDLSNIRGLKDVVLNAEHITKLKVLTEELKVSMNPKNFLHIGKSIEHNVKCASFFVSSRSEMREISRVFVEARNRGILL